MGPGISESPLGFIPFFLFFKKFIYAPLKGYSWCAAFQPGQEWFPYSGHCVDPKQRSVCMQSVKLPPSQTSFLDFENHEQTTLLLELTHEVAQCVKILHRNKLNRIHKEEKVYFDKLAHIIVESGKSQDLQGFSVSWTPRRANICLKPKRNPSSDCQEARILSGLGWLAFFFFLYSPSAGWMRANHAEDNLLIQCPNVNVNLIQKCSNTQNYS